MRGYQINVRKSTEQGKKTTQRTRNHSTGWDPPVHARGGWPASRQQMQPHGRKFDKVCALLSFAAPGWVPLPPPPPFSTVTSWGGLSPGKPSLSPRTSPFPRGAASPETPVWSSQPPRHQAEAVPAAARSSPSITRPEIPHGCCSWRVLQHGSAPSAGTALPTSFSCPPRAGLLTATAGEETGPVPFSTFPSAYARLLRTCGTPRPVSPKVLGCFPRRTSTGWKQLSPSRLRAHNRRWITLSVSLFYLLLPHSFTTRWFTALGSGRQ